MLKQVVLLAIVAAAIGSGIVGGIFYAFSSFVMAGLGRIPPEQGTAAMNAINVTVITPSFMIPFMGTALLSLGLAASGVMSFDQTSGKLLVAAGLLYLVGTLGVTMVFNVPLNDRLAVVTAQGLPALWSDYLDIWTTWNHVRTAASLLSAVAFVAAFIAA